MSKKRRLIVEIDDEEFVVPSRVEDDIYSFCEIKGIPFRWKSL